VIAPISTLPCLLLRSNAVGASRGSVGSEHTGVPTAANEFSGYRSRPRSAETGGDFPSRLLSLDLLAWTFLDFLNSRPALVPGSLVPIVSCPVRRESSLLLLLASVCFFSLQLSSAFCFSFLSLSTFYFLFSVFILRSCSGSSFGSYDCDDWAGTTSPRLLLQAPESGSASRALTPRRASCPPVGPSFHETDRGTRRPLDLPSPTGNRHSERRPSRRIHGRWERDLSPLVVDRRTKPRVGRSLQRRN
jgi:hypothetical protein